MSLIPQVEERLAEVRSRRATAKAEIDRVLAPAQRGKRDLNPAETTKFDALVSEVRNLDEEAEQLDLRIKELTVNETREAAAAACRVETGHVGLQRGYVGATEVYRPDVPETSFFRDLYAARRGDYGAAERLHRNNALAGTERRAGSTTAGAGGEFAPPGWLIDEFVALARPGRVTADLCHKEPLPTGVSNINLPRVSGGTTTAVQATQNTAVSDTTATTDSVSSGITTVAGKQVVSLQLLEQSGIPFDKVILADLAADYAKELDLQVISGSGASGQLRGLLTISGSNAVTFTSSSPVVAGSTAADSLLFQVNSAANQIHTSVFKPATGIVMHPRRWAWIMAAVDGQNRPLVTPDGQQYNGPAVSTQPTAQGAAGTLGGLPVHLDPNIPTNLGAGTNQDPILVCRWDEEHVWESELRAETFDAPYADSMGVLFRTFAYSAAILDRRPTAVSIINGTGLVAPAGL